MKPERACEILFAILSGKKELADVATTDEIKNIKVQWRLMPGYTTMYDAIHALAYPHKWTEITHDNPPKTN